MLLGGNLPESMAQYLYPGHDVEPTREDGVLEEAATSEKEEDRIKADAAR
jgi:hypothetical protein